MADYSPDDIARLRAALAQGGGPQSPDQIDANNAALQAALSGQAPPQTPPAAPGPSQAPPSVPQGPQGQAFAASLQSALSPPTTVKPSETSASAPPVNSYAQAPGAPPVDATPRAQVVPEHWVNTMAPEDRPKLEQGQKQQLEGVQGQAAAESEGADAMAQIAQRGAEDQRIQQLKDQQEYARQKSALDLHMQQLQQRADAISKQKIDPMHVFGAKGSGERTGRIVLATIGQALGAFGAALSHGPNMAAEIVNRAIDADIASQEKNIQNSKEGLETQRGLLAQKLQLFGDLPKAQAATRQEMLQATAAEIDAMARKYQSPAIQARGQQMIGELMQRFATEDAAIKKYVPAQQVGGPGYGVSDVKPDEVITTPEGRQVTVPTADREKVIAAQRTAETVKGAADSMRTLLRTPLDQRAANWASWSRSYDAAREVLASAEMQAGGKSGKGMVEMNMDAAGARHLILAPGADKALDQIVAGAQRNYNAAIDNSAQYEVEPQLVTNLKGETERKYRIKGQYQRRSQEGSSLRTFKPAGGS